MTATIIGATGLIGGYLLEELLQDKYYNTVRILIRRPLELTQPKLEKKQVDFTNAESFRLALEGSDVVFCAIGTTQKKVNGDKEAYRKVDYDITVNAARFCKMNGCKTFVFVSSVGANSKSNNFYLKLKGEIEEAVKAVDLKSVHIMQPSLLIGNRNEFRLSEKIAQWTMPVFSFLIPKKYRPVHARDVARGMVNCSLYKLSGQVSYRSDIIKLMSKRLSTNSQTKSKAEQEIIKPNDLIGKLKVKIIEFVDDYQPGIVKCSFVDTEGKEWFFIEKVPVVSLENLDEKSEYPKEGIVECRIVKKEVINNKEIVSIALDSIVEDSFEEREYLFDVYSEELIL